MRRRAALTGALVAAALLLTGCTEAGPDGSDAGLTEAVTQWKQPTTGPVVFSGPTVTGSTFSSKSALGKVLVVNFWYAQCPPCRSEADDLQAVAAKYADRGVQFVGVNTIDSKDDAAGFVRDFTIRYPSVLDQAAGGSVQLAFASTTPPKAVPTTLVLDRKGRVVARYVGAINRSVLGTLIDNALDGEDGVSALVGSGALLLGAPIAFAAGALSFASPCVLPLVPGYLGYVGGMDTGTAGRRRPSGRLVLGAALFVLGFSIVFVLAGYAFGAAGVFLGQWGSTITRFAGVVVIVLGVVFVGGIGPAQRTIKPTWRPRVGLAGAPLLGAVFAVGWTPCLGPTLSLITALSLSSGTVTTGVLLAAVYSLGLGVPFVLIAVGLGWATRTTAFLKRHVRAINLSGGALLIVVGLLMVTGLWSSVVSTLQAALGSYEPPI